MKVAGTPVTSSEKKCFVQFLRSPLSIARISPKILKMELSVNHLTDPFSETAKVRASEENEILETGLVIKSIGYTTVALDPCIPIDESRGCIRNDGGKIPGLGSGMYCSGWAATGPSGVLLGTMNTSFEVGKNIIRDVESGEIVLDSKPGGHLIRKLLTERGKQYVTFEDWSRIDQKEREIGEKEGKPREKFVSVEEMVAAAKSHLEKQ